MKYNYFYFAVIETTDDGKNYAYAVRVSETIYKGIAEFFTRYGFTVKQHGIGFQITF